MRQRRSTAWIPALLLFAGAAAPALADHEVVVRDESAAFPVDGVRRLELDVPVGEVHVQAGGGDSITAQLKLSCDQYSRRCRDHAARLQLTSTRDGDDLSLQVTGYDRGKKTGINHPELELHLTVPAALAVAVDMGVGELDLEGIEGDVTVDLGVGEARVEMPEGAVRSVSLDVGVGEANLSPRRDDQHRDGFLFLGNEVDWREGTGQARVSLNVGVGEATVRLTP